MSGPRAISDQTRPDSVADDAGGARLPAAAAQGSGDAAASKRAGRRGSGKQGGERLAPALSPASDAPPEDGETGEDVLAGGLYLVATPIGNLADISLRALSVLRRATVIACEDTRVTGKLAQRYGITTHRLVYNDHNGERMRPALIERLRRGESVALVSDAGTPLVSDPGYKLARAAIDGGLAVTAVPGASAPLTALALSGLPSDRFLFAGFLPPRMTARRRVLGELAAVPATLIFFEAPQRLAESLADMAATLGDRPAAIARELTKRYEEVRRDRLSVLAQDTAATPPRGEIVVVVGPPGSAPAVAETDTAQTLDEQLRKALADASLRDAVDAVAAVTGKPRREVYARALALTAERGR